MSNLKTKKNPVLLYRDFWDENGKRYSKGDTVELDVDVAKKLISEGKAERADPLPGEV